MLSKHYWCEVISPKRWHKRPQPLPPHKGQQLDKCPSTKAALRELWSPLKKQRIETKNLRITIEKEKKGRFIFPTSSHLTSQHCSVLWGNAPTKKKFPLQGRKEWGEQKASSAFEGTAKRSCLVSPYASDQQNWDIEMARNEEGKQGLPIAAMQQLYSQFPVTCSATTPAAFATKERNSQNSCCRPSADFTSFCPIDTCIHWWQLPGPTLVLPSAHPHWSLRTAPAGLSGCVSASRQLRLPQHHVHAWVSTFSCASTCPQLWNKPNKVVYTSSQDPSSFQ